jgi:hypothetical protein
MQAARDSAGSAGRCQTPMTSFDMPVSALTELSRKTIAADEFHWR